MKIFQYICSAAFGVMVVGVATCAARPDLPALTPSQQVELKTLTAQLSDPERTARTRGEAAILLLTRTYPQADIALCDFLADASNRPAQIAVAGAIVQSGRADKQFIKPLAAMLTSDEPAVRIPAAEALATCKDFGGLDEMIRILSNPKTDRDIRLVIISAMQRILDKKAVDALVSLLNDKDESIRYAACDALSNLTSIRAFVRDTQQWKKWWSENKNKRHSDWLADLAENLAVENRDLNRENAELRRRLASVMNDLYTATLPEGRDALLTDMLADPLAEVRLAAVRLVQQRLATGKKPDEPLWVQVRARVMDTDPAVRAVAVVLLADIADKQASKLLTSRLKVEQSDEVRRAIYQGLGLLGDVSAWEQILTGIAEPDRQVASAAAGALARIAEKNSLSDDRRSAAAAALTKRYKTGAGNGSAGLRESLLEAMGVLKDERLSKLLTSALKDPSAAVRLSGIKALQRLMLTESASAVAPLVRDPDRGVRLAAIAAVGSLGQAEHIETILARADAKVEPDAAVRGQAWSVVMSLLGKVETVKLQDLADKLSQRDGADEYLIDVLKLWSARILLEQTDEWIPVRLRLGRALLKADRPAEAAGELAAVHAAMVEAKDPQAPKVWREWIETLLAAGDASAVTNIAEVKDDSQFASAIASLQKRLDALNAAKNWDAVVRLAGSALARLADRLNEPQKKAIEKALSYGRAQQSLADRQRVATLVVRLTGADETAGQAAARELATMKDRATGPLIEQLRKTISSEKPDPAAEKRILDVLSTLAPQLKGYDPGADPAERIKTLDEWIKDRS